MPEQQINPRSATVGLNLDSTIEQVGQGQLSYSLNSQIESFSGEQITYQNEAGNILCVTFPDAYKVIGIKNITQIYKVVYFLTNPTTGDSEIGYSDNDQCVYNTLISDKGNDLKFNFNINYPILKVVSKTTNCSNQLYWTDGLNPRRYIDLNNLPWKDVPNPNNSFEPIPLVGQLDTNKILIQPNFSIPQVIPTKVITGGILVAGTYQFSIQYANVNGEGYTSFYNVTNPLGIFENQIGTAFNLQTTKAISLEINNLDTSGLFDYYNLAVVKTINNTPTVQFIGTFPIINTSSTYTYTGEINSTQLLTIGDIFEKYPYYDVAQDIFEVDNVLGWANLIQTEQLNYQNIWSNVHLQWETWKVPYTQFEAYSNGLNTEALRGYMRDEIYAFEGCFLLSNGMQTQSFTIPGRTIQQTDIYPQVSSTDLDSTAISLDNCNAESILLPRWKVYNTASNLGYSSLADLSKIETDCYVGAYEYGEMSYYESTEVYPNNPDIWGNLSGQPIRHHKFPDSLVTHIHDPNNTINNDPQFIHSIFPIGVRIDTQSLYQAIASSSLTQNQKNQIVGFKIARGNRASNKSIVAKGMFSNVGKYEYTPVDPDYVNNKLSFPDEAKSFYYPNYPYNDLNSDPYFTNLPVTPRSGYIASSEISGFDSLDSQQRFTFHSPDTHFYQPSLDAGLYTKFETIEYGESYGHFIQVDQNAKYQFLTQDAYRVGYGVGIASAVNLSTSSGGSGVNLNMGLNIQNGFSAFTSFIDILEKTLPYNNLGYTFNSYGLYNKFYPIQNDGNKQRQSNYIKYLNSGYNSIEDRNTINNYQRESSVYIKNDSTIPYTKDYIADDKLVDNSRYTLASYSGNDLYTQFLNGLISINAGTTQNVSTNPGYISTSDIMNQLAFYPVITAYQPLYFFKYTCQTQTVNVGDIYLWGNNVSANQYGTLQILSQSITPDTSCSNDSFSGFIYALLIDGTGMSSNTNPGADILVAKGQGSPFTSLEVQYDTVTQDSLYNYFVVNPNDYAGGVVFKLQSIASEADLNALNILNINSISDYLAQAAYVNFQLALKSYQQSQNFKTAPETIRESNISAFYGSIKNNISNLYGQIYSYETIDTGFYSELFQSNGSNFTNFPTVFGGDIFINRFALKTKMPIFTDNTVADPDQTDISYDQIANLTYPMFWLSTKPASDFNSLVNTISSDISPIANFNVGSILGGIVGGTLGGFLGGLIGAAVGIILDIGTGGLAIAVDGALITAGETAGKAIGAYAGTAIAGGPTLVNLFGASFKTLFDILAALRDNYGIKSINLDRYVQSSSDGSSTKLYEQGIMYLFNYGIPYFFVESEVNCDYRQAFNDREGNFYPNVSNQIPDQWLQQVNVPIAQDNTYNYNQTYSKQNKENFFAHIRPDYDPNNPCFTNFPNRAIWSEQSTLEETNNNWLTYLPASRFDFSKSYGPLISLDKLQNKQVLARFDTKSQIYNAFTTVEVSQGPNAFLGNSKLFEAQPVDISETDSGYAGSQNKLILKTPKGHIFVDSKRGQVICLQGTQGIKDLASKGLDKWFSLNLPFTLINYFPQINIDNNFNGVGLHGVYDALFERLILTKIDYDIISTVFYNSGKFYNLDPLIDSSELKEIQLGNEAYFCDKSWTLSYSFKTDSWTSFHSYIPNFYIEHPNYYQSGYNNLGSLWSHNKTYELFNNYCGTNYPYIIEYPFAYKIQDEILQNVKEYCTAIKYSNFELSYEPDETIYFNESIIYNKNQCSGKLNLIPRPYNNLSINFQYPKYNTDSKDILVVKSDHFFQYNTFWNIQKDSNTNAFITSCNLRVSDKILNEDNLDYTQRVYKKAQIRGKDCKIRHSLTNRNDIKLIQKFILAPTDISYK